MTVGRKTGGGSRKGVPNEVGADIKEMILKALDHVGGWTYLADQANTSPGAFLTLLGKVLPTQLSGVGGGAIKILVDTGVQRTDDEPDDDTQDEFGIPRT